MRKERKKESSSSSCWPYWPYSYVAEGGGGTPSQAGRLPKAVPASLSAESREKPEAFSVGRRSSSTPHRPASVRAAIGSMVPVQFHHQLSTNRLRVCQCLCVLAARGKNRRLTTAGKTCQLFKSTVQVDFWFVSHVVNGGTGDGVSTNHHRSMVYTDEREVGGGGASGRCWLLACFLAGWPAQDNLLRFDCVTTPGSSTRGEPNRHDRERKKKENLSRKGIFLLLWLALFLMCWQLHSQKKKLLLLLLLF